MNMKHRGRSRTGVENAVRNSHRRLAPREWANSVEAGFRTCVSAVGLTESPSHFPNRFVRSGENSGMSDSFQRLPWRGPLLIFVAEHRIPDEVCTLRHPKITTNPFQSKMNRLCYRLRTTKTGCIATPRSVLLSARNDYFAAITILVPLKRSGFVNNTVAFPPSKVTL